MSNIAVMERPPQLAELEWTILDQPEDRSIRTRVQMAGRGRERHGVVGRGGVTAAPPTLVALPSVDDLT